jgi:hypothetical protein
MKFVQNLRTIYHGILIQRFSIMMSLMVMFLLSSCKEKDTSPVAASGGSSTTTSTYWGQVFTFTRDEASKVSAVLDTTAVTLSVTDGSGIQWTLSIPRQESYMNETITMIPLSNIHSSTDSIQMKGGVLFEPDGLYFATPATLTVVVPAGSSTSSVYVFDHHGANLWYADAIKSGNSYSVNMTHFSGSGVGDDPSVQALCEKSKQALQSAYAEMNNVLQQALNIPTPPSIPVECPSNTSLGLAYSYVSDLINPEFNAITKIISAARNCELVCSDAENFSQVVSKMSPLYNRLDQKANTLLNQYGNTQNADKYFAIGRAVTTIDWSATLVGYRSDPLYLTRLSDWALTLRDEYIRRLKVEHDYKAGTAVLELERQAGLLGASTNTEETMGKLEKAMMFELVIKANVQVPKTATTTGTSYQVEGVVKNIRFTYSDMLWHNDGAEFTMVSGTLDGTNDRQYKIGTYQSPTTYSATMKFDLKPCNESAEIVIDRFAPQSETWSITVDIYSDNKPPETTTETTSWAHAYFTGAFFSKIMEPGVFKFTPTITNKNIEAVNQVFNSELPNVFTGNIEFKLTHKPQ